MLESFKNLSLSKKILVLLFLIIELVLFVLIQIPDQEYFSIFCFLSVGVTWFFACLNFKKSLHNILIIAGLFATLCADVFLVLFDPINQIMGMVFFNIAQIIYFVLIFSKANSKREKVVHLIVRACALVLMLIICWLVLKEKTDFLSMISIFYITNLVLNIVFSIVHERKVSLFSIGLILFLMCDLLVGFQMAMDVYLNISQNSLIYKIIHSEIKWAWVFYVPAQTLIALSLAFRKTNKEKQKNEHKEDDENLSQT